MNRIAALQSQHLGHNSRVENREHICLEFDIAPRHEEARSHSASSCPRRSTWRTSTGLGHLFFHFEAESTMSRPAHNALRHSDLLSSWHAHHELMRLLVLRFTGTCHPQTFRRRPLPLALRFGLEIKLLWAQSRAALPCAAARGTRCNAGPSCSQCSRNKTHSRFKKWAAHHAVEPRMKRKRLPEPKKAS